MDGNLLKITKRTDDRLLKSMEVHYSHPKGFVGRNICYSIEYENIYYGHIVGGSATLHLPGRNEFFGGMPDLNKICNNTYYHIEKFKGNYPIRNFAIAVLKEFQNRIVVDWEEKYKDILIGFESLVELPRTGEIYRRDGWVEVGLTKGYTCKRIAGKGSDGWTGKRIWDTSNLRPKIVFCKKTVCNSR